MQRQCSGFGLLAEQILLQSGILELFDRKKRKGLWEATKYNHNAMQPIASHLPCLVLEPIPLLRAREREREEKKEQKRTSSIPILASCGTYLWPFVPNCNWDWCDQSSRISCRQIDKDVNSQFLCIRPDSIPKLFFFFFTKLIIIIKKCM